MTERPEDVTGDGADGTTDPGPAEVDRDEVVSPAEVEAVPEERVQAAAAEANGDASADGPVDGTATDDAGDESRDTHDEAGTSDRGAGAGGGGGASTQQDAAPKELPGHASTVVVPLANPETAADLLALALAFCEHGGEVRGVTVGTDDAGAEAAAEVTAELTSIVDDLQHDHPDHDIQLVARSAPSVARGIVELAREENADLILLGVARPDGTAGTTEHPLGSIAESVISVAPCDVVVLRPGLDDEHVADLRRVVVSVDGGEASRTATRTGVVLGDGLGLRVDVVHVVDRATPRWDGLAVLAASLDGVDGRQRCHTRLLTGADTARTVIAATEHTDLLVVGLQRESGLRRWLFGSVSSSLVADARGPVLVVARKAVSEGVKGRLERIADWVRPHLTDVEQETLLWTARRQATTTIDYITLLAVATVLAALGLAQDSVAVIIGAMLVAPLLGPLSAVSIGLVTARLDLLRRGALTVAIGTTAAIAVSIAIGWLLPLTEPTEQMLLRGAPSLLDVAVAVASGAVGAFATARKDIPAALAGVAIAAALVPPLGTVGFGIAFGDGGLAGGAMLLFLVNIASVVITGAVAFIWFGLRPVEQDHNATRQLTAAALGIGTAFLVVTTTIGLLEATRTEDAAREQLLARLDVGEGVELLELEIEERDTSASVTATVRTTRDLGDEDLLVVEDRLATELGRPVELRVVVLRVVTPPG